MPFARRRLLLFVLCSGGALGNVSCTTYLTPNQRQELETRVYAASRADTFAAVRDALVNRGYRIASSDFRGGVLTCEREEMDRSAGLALGLSFLCPTAGDFYNERYGWGVFDAFLWPFSIIWAAPSNYFLAEKSYALVNGTVSFEDLGKGGTRIRIAFSGVPWDAEEYPIRIRDLQEEVERQIFIKEGARASPN